MSKSKKLIEIFNTLESRSAKWLLAVDENIKNLKPYLEKIGFKVLFFGSGLDDEEIHDQLIKKRVDFFVTKNGKDFMYHVIKSPSPRLQYSLLWVTQDVTADLTRLAQTIEKAIMYDIKLRNRSNPGILVISGQYITNLPNIKAEYLQSHKK